MDLILIEKLLQLMEKSTAEELEVTEEGVTIRISRRSTSAAPSRIPPGAPQGAIMGAEAAPSQIPAATTGLREIAAGMTGIFYRSPSPEKPPFVEPGMAIRDGQTMALLEAMKTFNPVESECDGELVAVLAEDGMMVEAGTPLFRIRQA